MTISRRQVLFGAGAFAAAGLTGCAPSPSQPSAPQGDAETKELTFSSWSMNEAASKDQLGGLLQAWSTSSGVKINTPSYPYNDYVQQMLLQIRGGTLTGAAQVDISTLATFAAAGRLVDLGESARKADYTDKALAVTQVNGKQVGLPWTTAAIGLVGNGKLLQQAGITTPPTTIGEFEQALEKLKQLGVTPYAAMTKLAQLKDIVPWMWQFGSPVYDGKAVTVGDAASVEAVTWYKSLLDRKLIAPEVDRFDARALFGQGKVGIYEDAIAGKKFIASSTKDTALADAMTPLPRPVVKSGDQPKCLAWGHTIVVFDGAGRATATRLAEHLTGDTATVVDYFKKANYPPPTKAGLAAPEVAADTWTTQFTERVTSSGQANPLWVLPQYAQIEQKLAQHVQRVLVGQASSQDALNEAKKDIESLVRK
jgi:ABC-type glycerol-3-phosphate transport system substrate-binding protein